MRQITKLISGCLLVVGFTAGVMGSSAAQAQSVLRAIAAIQGAPGSGISGRALFEQTQEGILPTVEISVFVRGLEPITVHGVHIHEIGNCTPPDFLGAGGHFDPGPFGMSNPDANHPFHMGDLINLEADNRGRAFFIYRTSRITLSDSLVSIFDGDGSAVIIHLNPDQGIIGESGSGVSGGPRIACGVIRLRSNNTG
jgi:superoxide dismutase, Cu-Zn family